MKTTKSYTYIASIVEIVEVNAEYGFAGSVFEDPIEKNRTRLVGSKHKSNNKR